MVELTIRLDENCGKEGEYENLSGAERVYKRHRKRGGSDAIMRGGMGSSILTIALGKFR